ncbi:hypothetical protein LAZ67_19002715 [Cordylochernes scorpioides]|uniref:PiggyBac transposable element-derived protein domain-containing protein n=1 Tax=Cordylochernes scorpioides TaxID=51811 RepID=A0ABY6LKF3_9ARAC|nr:hypothetical protein LAZ67_19002715 [Cordylochernes scorpioides]
MQILGYLSTKTSQNDSYRFTPATLSGTLPAPDAHPSEYFYLFMTPSLLQSIVDQTNIYASQYISANRSTAKPRSRFLNWTNTNLDEMKAFLGLILNMGLIKKRRIFEYWNKRNWSQDSPAFFRIPRDIFWLILKFLHLNNNQNDTKVDPLFKVSPVLESLNKSFLKYYIPDRNLSIDESLVKQKKIEPKRGNISPNPMPNLESNTGSYVKLKVATPSSLTSMRERPTPHLLLLKGWHLMWYSG